jgi:hypothetical protein
MAPGPELRKPTIPRLLELNYGTRRGEITREVMKMLICFVQAAKMNGRGHRVKPWAEASRKAAGSDPPEIPRPSFRDDPPRWDSHRFGSPDPRPCGRHRARSTSSTGSSRLGRRTHDRVRRLSRPAPGCVARSQWSQARTAGGHAMAAARAGQHAMPRMNRPIARGWGCSILICQFAWFASGTAAKSALRARADRPVRGRAGSGRF